MVRRLAAVIALVVASLLAQATTAAAAPAAPPADRDATEAAFVDRINELRQTKGLGPLAVDPQLRDVARDWAAKMVRAGRISHRPNLAKVPPHPRWVKIGENVGVGGSVTSLHDAFVASKAHYVNLVDPAWQFVGIGVVYDGDTIYVAENFMEVEEAEEIEVDEPAEPVLIAAVTPAPRPAGPTCEAGRCPVARFVVARR